MKHRVRNFIVPALVLVNFIKERASVTIKTTKNIQLTMLIEFNLLYIFFHLINSQYLEIVITVTLKAY